MFAARPHDVGIARVASMRTGERNLQVLHLDETSGEPIPVHTAHLLSVASFIGDVRRQSER
jgi:hypothetical protein